MIKVYIVSLERDIEKRNKISNVLEGFDVNYEFVNAIYGKDIEPENIDRIRGDFIDYSRKIGEGEIGCLLSHIDTYRKIDDNDDEWSIILEDDVILDYRFYNFIENFNSGNLKYDNLYILGGQDGLLSEKMQVKSVFNRFFIGEAEFRKAINSSKYIYRTCCYLMNKKMAKAIINQSYKNLYLVDDWDYLINQKIIKHIYLSNIVAHPIDLTNSLIQQDREQGVKKSTLSRYKENEFLRSFYAMLRKIMSLGF